jgi:Tfp pilus assembly protein PilV
MQRASPDRSHRSHESGFTLVEVLVAAGLIILVLTGIYTMQAQAMQILRGSRNASSASQMMQQRVEQLRGLSYAKAASSASVLALMNGASGGTQAEREMIGARNLTESVTIFPYYRPSVTPPTTSQSFTITRSGNTATGPTTATTLSAQSQIKASLRVTWDDRSGSHRREFTTVLSDGGLSAAGISTKP